jgi:hypothetical protein
MLLSDILQSADSAAGQPSCIAADLATVEIAAKILVLADFSFLRNTRLVRKH